MSRAGETEGWSKLEKRVYKLLRRVLYAYIGIRDYEHRTGGVYKLNDSTHNPNLHIEALLALYELKLILRGRS